LLIGGGAPAHVYTLYTTLYSHVVCGVYMCAGALFPMSKDLMSYISLFCLILFYYNSYSLYSHSGYPDGTGKPWQLQNFYVQSHFICYGIVSTQPQNGEAQDM